MTVLTIRATSQQSKTIDKIKSFFGIGHGSKALLRAAEELPKLNNKYNKLESKHQELVWRHQELIDALNEKKNIQSKIDDLTKLRSKL